MPTFSTRTVGLLLGANSLLLSRLTFFFIEDSEGPNLLVVFGVALILFVPSLAVYLANSPLTAAKKLLLAIVIQVLLAIAFYCFAVTF